MGSHDSQHRRRHGGDAADSSVLHGRRTQQVAPCARRDGAGSPGDVGSHRVGPHRSHAELHEMTVSGLGSRVSADPSGGAEVAAAGGGDTIGESEECESGGMRGRFRGCHRGSDVECAVWIDRETSSATCSCRFVSAVHEGSSSRPAGVPLHLPGSAVTWTGGVARVTVTSTLTSSTTSTVTSVCMTWSAASRSVNCHCSASVASGASRTGRQHCCGPRATWSATGCRTTSGTGSASWSASGHCAVPAARDAGCGAGHAGAFQTPPGGRPPADCGSFCRGSRLLDRMAWPEGCSLLQMARGSAEEPRSSQSDQGAVPAQGMGAVAGWAVPCGVPVEVGACAKEAEGSCLRCRLRSSLHRCHCMGGSHPSGSHHLTGGCRLDRSRDVTDDVRSLLHVGLNGGASLAQMVL